MAVLKGLHLVGKPDEFEIGLAEGIRPERKKFNRGVFGLYALFGVMYFVQGVSEPNAGLITQPVTSLLTRWQLDPTEIGTFMFWLGFPWFFKPIYGLISDFLPIFGYRRKSYLLLCSLVSCIGLAVLAAIPLHAGSTDFLLAMLLLPAFGLAFSDVAIDGLMVEKGKPRGITGKLQSVQWGSVCTASVIVGFIGGILSDAEQQQLGFLICSFFCGLGFVSTLVFVREERAPRAAGFWKAINELRRAMFSPGVMAIGLFVFLLSFNTLSTALVYQFCTQVLSISDTAYGAVSSMSYGAMVAACFVYPLICRRLSYRQLIHTAIALTAISSLGGCMMYGYTSFLISSIAFGFLYMISLLIMLDVTAKNCPTLVAGTMFAALMAISNFSMTFSGWIGSYMYVGITESIGVYLARDALAITAAAATAACWLVAPLIIRLTEANAMAADLADNPSENNGAAPPDDSRD